MEENHALRGTQVQVGRELGLGQHCWPALYSLSPWGWDGAGQGGTAGSLVADCGQPQAALPS